MKALRARLVGGINLAVLVGVALEEIAKSERPSAIGLPFQIVFDIQSRIGGRQTSERLCRRHPAIGIGVVGEGQCRRVVLAIVIADPGRIGQIVSQSRIQHVVGEEGVHFAVQA